MNHTVSVCIISYNQEAYIEATLKGALIQQLSTPYEIVVGDDCSPDGTRRIAADLASQDPRIRMLPEGRNLGVNGNWARTIEACSGQYIAICEGDDVWTDTMKLQKQIDLLEKNPGASACFSNANVMNDDGSLSPYPYVDKNLDLLRAKDFFKLNFNPVPTCTLVFRRSCLETFPPEYYNSPFADWILHTMLIQKGDYVYLPETTASYRKHSGGVWSGIKEEKQLLNKLKAIGIVGSLVRKEFATDVRSAKRKQLDSLLYFYRSSGNLLKYFQIWLRLKRTLP